MLVLYSLPGLFYPVKGYLLRAALRSCMLPFAVLSSLGYAPFILYLADVTVPSVELESVHTTLANLYPTSTSSKSTEPAAVTATGAPMSVQFVMLPTSLSHDP